jgi:hypothetical protein
MPVEIHVLSGSRQSERVYIDAPTFRVGDQRDCEVFFDPSRDQAAQGRAALFRLQDDGWYVQSTGQSNVLVNDQRLTGSMRIRSGDVVRMSDRGPDFSFGMVTGPRQTPRAMPGEVLPSPTTGNATDSRQPDVAEPLESVESADLTLAESESPAEPEISFVPIGRWEPRIPSRRILAGGVVVLMLGIGLLLWMTGGYGLFTPQSPASQSKASSPIEQTPTLPKPPVSAKPAETPVQDSAGPLAGEGQGVRVGDSETASESATPPISPEKPRNVKPDEPSKEPTQAGSASEPQTASAKDPWEAVGQTAKKGILMLCVQDTRTDSVWVVATGSAISEKLILTTAAAATELANDYREDYWKVWACQDPRADKFPLKDIRVHVGYVKAGDDLQKKVYFDVALISVDRTLPATLPLASADVFSDLERGYPLACVEIPHDREAINRFQPLKPELVPAKVFAITSLERTADAPRLLHVNASIPPNSFGSPLITTEGGVTAVYSTPAAVPDDKLAQELRLHYAVVVEPQLIELWKQGQGTTVWVAPTPSLGTPPARKPTP